MCQCTQFGTLRYSRQCSQDWSRLGFVSALPQLRLGYASTMPHLRLDYALASISCEHCRSSRNHSHCVPRHIIYYFNPELYLIPTGRNIYFSVWGLPDTWLRVHRFLIIYIYIRFYRNYFLIMIRTHQCFFLIVIIVGLC